MSKSIDLATEPEVTFYWKSNAPNHDPVVIFEGEPNGGRHDPPYNHSEMLPWGPALGGYEVQMGGCGPEAEFKNGQAAPTSITAGGGDNCPFWPGITPEIASIWQGSRGDWWFPFKHLSSRGEVRDYYRPYTLRLSDCKEICDADPDCGAFQRISREDIKRCDPSTADCFQGGGKFGACTIARGWSTSYGCMSFKNQDGSGGGYCALFRAGCTGNYKYDKNHINAQCYVKSSTTGWGHAGGDPHLVNIKGEKFNIARQGSAPLVKIASGGAPHLEVMALIEGKRKCHKKMFISQVNASGSWLEKKVAVTVGDQTESKAFTMTVDGQEVWSPPSEGYQSPTTQNVLFNVDGKFSVSEMYNPAKSNVHQPGVQVSLPHDVEMKIMRPLRRSTTTPHLNFDIKGLHKLQGSFAVGGLLGLDDHSSWTTQDKDCRAEFSRIEPEKYEQGSLATATP